MYGDVPLIEPESMSAMLDGRRDGAPPMALAVVELDEPTATAVVVRTADGTVERIVEFKDATEDEREDHADQRRAVRVRRRLAARGARRLTPIAATGELYLTQLVEIAAADGTPAVAVEHRRGRLGRASSPASTTARTSPRPADAPVAIVQRLMEEGVTFHDPGSASSSTPRSRSRRT